MIALGPRYKQCFRLRTLFWQNAKPLAKKQWREWRIFVKRKPRYKYFNSHQIKLSFFPEKLQKNNYRTSLHLKQKLNYFYGRLKHRSMKKAINLGIQKQKLENRLDTSLYRFGYSLSFREIRQWIQHKQVLSLGSSSNIYYPKSGFANHLLRQGENIQNLQNTYTPYLNYINQFGLPNSLFKTKSSLSNITKILTKNPTNFLWSKNNFKNYNSLIHIDFPGTHKIYPFRVDTHRLYKFYRNLKIK